MNWMLEPIHLIHEALPSKLNPGEHQFSYDFIHICSTIFTAGGCWCSMNWKLGPIHLIHEALPSRFGPERHQISYDFTCICSTFFSLLGAAGAPWIWCWGQYTACMRLCPAYWALSLGLQRTWASSPGLFHPKSRKRVHNFQTIKSKFYCKLYTSPPGGGPSDRRKKMQGPQMCFSNNWFFQSAWEGLVSRSETLKNICIFIEISVNQYKTYAKHLFSLQIYR